MVAMSLIYTEVPAPAVTPHPFGLFSVASPQSPADASWLAGVTWESWACLDPNTTNDPCIVGGQPADPKEFEQCPDTQSWKPITVYLGVQRAGGIGLNAEQASQSLTDAEEFALERWLWDQMAAGVADEGSGGTSADLPTALGTVDALLGANYHGTGVIHMSRLTANLLASYLVKSGSTLTTITGTPVVVGGGYDLGTLGGTPSLPVIYGTGALAIRRGPVDTVSAWNRAINDELSLAERTYVVGWDCYVASRGLGS